MPEPRLSHHLVEGGRLVIEVGAMIITANRSNLYIILFSELACRHLREAEARG
jgi:hypothetical protein